jgi:hypothetical protein
MADEAVNCTTGCTCPSIWLGVVPPPPCPLHTAPSPIGALFQEYLGSGPLLGTVKESWQCPGCREYKAPHVDSCGCAARAEPFVDPDEFERGPFSVTAPLARSCIVTTTGTTSAEYRYTNEPGEVG